MPSSEQNPLKSLLSNCVSLSEMAAQGMPKHVMMFFHRNRFVSTLRMFESGSASTHFGEIICCCDQEPLVPWGPRKRPHNIQSPLGKWPRAGQGIQFSGRLVDHRSKSLAFITFLNIFQGISLHVWPPISLGYSSMRQRSPSSVTSANSFMYLKEEIFHLIWMHA